MYQQPNTLTQNALSSQNCKSLFSLLQVVIGIALIVSSAYGYSLLQHMAVIIPAIMGTALIFHSVKTIFTCRVGSLFGGQQGHSDSMLG